MNRRTFLELSAAGAVSWMFGAACEAETEPLEAALEPPLEPPPDQPPDPPPAEPEGFVISESFDVILNDPSCSGHVHGIAVSAAAYAGDTPVRFLGGSHELEFLPSELVKLERGEKIPFATIGDGPGHGHCGTAWRTSVGAPDPTLVDLCVPRGTAMCISG